jgi:hypothetical protein
MTATLRPPGAEALARRVSLCKLCSSRVEVGDCIVDQTPIGWVHQPCADGYRRVIAEHAEEPEQVGFSQGSVGFSPDLKGAPPALGNKVSLDLTRFSRRGEGAQ